jgi:serine protease Do
VKPQAVSLSRSPQLMSRMLAVLALSTMMMLSWIAQAQARGAPESLADLAETVSPAVVNITTSTTVAAPASPGPMVPEGSPFEEFFKEFMDRNGQGGDNRRARRSQALGSGFVISEDGYIVTNNHVIDGADEIMIEFYDGMKLPAKVVGTDPKTDLALLKVESDTALTFVPFGDSDVSRVGDWVMAVGNPLGQGFSVSAGIISARNRTLSGSYDDFIQTDAAINKGNSGGPLFDMDGNVIGVNTAILSPTGGSIGIGFSMASNVVAPVIEQLRQFGETRRGWLGVRIQDVTEDVAEALGLESASGALVTDVPEGPASEAGILAGDVIISFDTADVVDTRGLVRQVGNTEVGKAVRIVVRRDGKSQTLLVTLGRREDAEASPIPVVAAPPAPKLGEVLGLSLSPMTAELRAELDLAASADGLVVTGVDEAAEAFAKGLRAGDVIVEAGQMAVSSVEDLNARIEQAREGGRKSLLLLLRRGGDPRFVALTLE